MRFNTWFTAKKSDGSVHKSEERVVISQEQFIQFVQLMANYIFGEEVIVELAESDDKLAFTTNKLNGSCLVKLKVQGPATTERAFHYFQINELRFCWEPHHGSIYIPRQWEKFSR